MNMNEALKLNLHDILPPHEDDYWKVCQVKGVEYDVNIHIPEKPNTIHVDFYAVTENQTDTTTCVGSYTITTPLITLIRTRT